MSKLSPHHLFGEGFLIGFIFPLGEVLVYLVDMNQNPQTMADLIHIVYLSYSVKELSESELNSLLATIRKKNEIQNITGLLLYNDEAFIQVIEGNRETIHQIFDLISKDSRHSNIVKLLEEPITKRAFPDWSMGFRKIDKEQNLQLPGFSDFMQNKHSEIDYEECAAAVRHLLYSFRKHT